MTLSSELPETGAQTGTGTGTETAGHAWRVMRELVLERNDRRRAVSEALGMSFVRVKALRRIAAAPVRMRDLSVSLGTDKPYTTLVVDYLETRGLIERTVDADDRRCRVVTVTEAGREAAARSGEILDAPPAVMQVLSDGEMAELDRLVTKMLDALPD